MKKNRISRILGAVALTGATLMLTGCLDSDSDSNTPTTEIPTQPIAAIIDVNQLEQTVADFVYSISAKNEMEDQLEYVLWYSIFEPDPNTEFPAAGQASGACHAGGSFERSVTYTGSNPTNFSFVAEFNQCLHATGLLALTGDFVASVKFTETSTMEEFDGEERINISALSANRFQLMAFKRDIKFLGKESESFDEEDMSGYYVLTGPSSISYVLTDYQETYRSGIEDTLSFNFSVSGEGVKNYTLSVVGQDHSDHFILKAANNDQLELQRHSSESFSVQLNGQACGTVTIEDAIQSVVNSVTPFTLNCATFR